MIGNLGYQVPGETKLLVVHLFTHFILDSKSVYVHRSKHAFHKYLNTHYIFESKCVDLHRPKRKSIFDSKCVHL